MQYIIVGCLGDNGLTRGGVEGMALPTVVRKNIEEGPPPFARWRVRGLKISLGEWGVVGEYAKPEIGHRKSAKNGATESARNRAPGRSILRKGVKKNGPMKSVAFARDLADIVPVESWKRCEL